MSRNAYINKDIPLSKIHEVKADLKHYIEFYEKITFIEDIYAGETVKYAIEKRGKTIPTGHAWLKAWNEKGFDGLLRKKGSGRKTKLTENQFKQLKENKISSKEFSELTGYTASQIRQDLNNFGGFGQQGYGYSVDALLEEITSILGLDKEYRMVLVGGGNLGQAIANYTHYANMGFLVESIFEVNPRLIGMRINGIKVRDYEDLTEFTKENNIDIGIICTTKNTAQEVADKLVAGGVSGIWNFTALDVNVPREVALENVHLSDSLHSLAYYMYHR